MIAPAKVEDVPDVKAGQSVIRMDSETGNSRCTVAIHIIAARLSELPKLSKSLASLSVFEYVYVAKEVQTIRKPLFERQQQTVVVAVPFGCCVAGIPS